MTNYASVFTFCWRVAVFSQVVTHHYAIRFQSVSVLGPRVIVAAEPSVSPTHTHIRSLVSKFILCPIAEKHYDDQISSASE